MKNYLEFFPTDQELNKLLNELNKISNETWFIDFKWIKINRVFADPKRILTATISKLVNNEKQIEYQANGILEIKYYLRGIIQQINKYKI
ncbi:hypothetical protein K9L16_04315 [Candidatus Pacearchaeota archaeon]|nr:hypothetical protein [Candidatus Pacearchaeota archaeon]